MAVSRVALVRCESYDHDEVKTSIARGLDLLGGVWLFAKPSDKLLLKPNLLSAVSPEECVTTHPSVFHAVAEAFKSAGAHLTYGDSPALGSPEKAALRAGIHEAADELGIKMADFHSGQSVSFPEGIQNKQFIIANGVLSSDGLISISKLKTHGLTLMTGAVKNQFGCIPGLSKGEFHVKLQEIENFSRMLVDLNRYLSPRLFIMDGVMAMEGNGPRNGTPRKMNLLLFSTDPVALDATVCRIIGLDPQAVATVAQGQAMGLGTHLQEEIELLGDPLAEFMVEDFKLGRKPRTWRLQSRRLRHLLVPRPQIDRERCLKCGICVNMCPVKPKVVNWKNSDKTQPPVYDYNRCIRCYCCQEVCPENAISIYTPILTRAAGLFQKSRF